MGLLVGFLQEVFQRAPGTDSPAEPGQSVLPEGPELATLTPRCYSLPLPRGFHFLVLFFFVFFAILLSDAVVWNEICVQIT